MIAAELLSAESLELGWAIYAPLLLLAAWRAPWVELVSDTRRQHLVFGTMLGLFLLWLVRRDFESGLSFHFIGMTAVTLLLDWPLAIVVGLVAQLGLCLLGRQDWLAIGVNGVLLVAIPALIAELAALFVEKRQPRNLFVYIFCCGFFPAALTAVVVLLLGLGVVWIDGLFPMPPWLEDFAGYLWLIMFPEAFINGTVITGLVVYYQVAGNLQSHALPAGALEGRRAQALMTSHSPGSWRAAADLRQCFGRSWPRSCRFPR